MKRFRILIALGFFAAFAPPSFAEEPLLIFAGAASRPVLEEAFARYQKAYGQEVKAVYSGSGVVLSQMILSRQGDLYIPGSQDFMEKAESRKAVNPSTRRVLAYLFPAILVSQGNPEHIHGLSDLAKPGLRLAIGNPESVCLGVFAKRIFGNSPCEAAILKNVVSHGRSCEDVLTSLLMGRVDAIIGWSVFAEWENAKGKVQLVPLGKEATGMSANIPAAVSAYSQQAEKAQRLLDFLSSAGRKIFAANGYEVEAPKVTGKP
ncbi:MAG TPA: substrate-binding domain-containing protein [Chroococcales cyanobacterium]|jgi:molybdate transport system substrate-binding protein